MQVKEFVGIAPARLDVMGGIADYSGSMVLEMPLDIHTKVSIRKRGDLMVNVISGELSTSLNFEEILSARGRIVVSRTWSKFALPEWSLYILGNIFVLLDQRDFEFVGLDIMVSSKIPIGSGLSSSAALEVSTMRALFQAFDLEPEQETLAVMAQMAENLVVGAPCGIMDQMTVHMGKQGHLLPILCQPYELMPMIPVPESIKIYGLDTGVKHRVAGSAYAIVRAAAFMGLKIISQVQKLNYLSELSVDEFESRFIKLLPDQMLGKEFIEKYASTADSLTEIKTDVLYSVKKCTSFPIYENERVREFSNYLLSTKIDKEELGKLMFASHQGYVDCGLSCEEADYIVNLVSEAGVSKGLYGARITGGGSGGTVCICAKNAGSIRRIQELFYEKYGFKSMLQKTGEGVVSW